MSILNSARIIGNILNILGYALFVNFNSLQGSILQIIGLSLNIPFAIKYKLWDILVVFSFFIVINLQNIINNIINLN